MTIYFHLLFRLVLIKGFYLSLARGYAAARHVEKKQSLRLVMFWETGAGHFSEFLNNRDQEKNSLQKDDL